MWKENERERVREASKTWYERILVHAVKNKLITSSWQFIANWNGLVWFVYTNNIMV